MTDTVFMKREIEPMTIEVAGNKLPAIFSYRAITDFEDRYDGVSADYIVPLLSIVYDEYGNIKTSEDGTPVPSLPSKIIITLLYCMVKAAGVDVDEDDFMNSIEYGELSSVIVQMRNVIENQRFKPKEKGESKNLKSATMKKK